MELFRYIFYNRIKLWNTRIIMARIPLYIHVSLDLLQILIEAFHCLCRSERWEIFSHILKVLICNHFNSVFVKFSLNTEFSHDSTNFDVTCIFFIVATELFLNFFLQTSITDRSIIFQFSLNSYANNQYGNFKHFKNFM